MKQDRTKMLLGLLGVLLLVLAWRFVGPSLGAGGGGDGGGDDLGNMTTSLGRVPGAGREDEPLVEDVVELRVADLQGQPRDYRPGRDPWRFAEPPPPPPPPPAPAPRRPTPEELRAQREIEERLRAQQQAAAEAAALEAAKPKPPPFTLKYVGKFGPADRPIGVFTDGKNVFNVQQGGVIQGKFIVAQIGLESVEIQFVGFPDWPPQRVGVGR